MANENLILGNNHPWADDPMYSFNSYEEQQAFKEWFIENAKEYPINPSFKFESEIMQQVIPAGCYGNSQYISVNTQARYAEGLVVPHGKYTFNDYIPHGFNILKNKVVDYTYKKIVQETPQYLPEMPTKYWGIEIPKEYILTIHGNNENKPLDFHRPLLLQYWRDIVEGNQSTKFTR